MQMTTNLWVPNWTPASRLLLFNIKFIFHLNHLTMNKILPEKFRLNEKNKNKKGIFCHYILVLKKRKKKGKIWEI
jgi:hypothetical protein